MLLSLKPEVVKDKKLPSEQGVLAVAVERMSPAERGGLIPGREVPRVKGH